MVSQLHVFTANKTEKEWRMSQTPVKTVTRTNQVPHRLRQLMAIVHNEIRQRAFRLFQEKGCQPGYELEDWVEAEHDVLCCPPCELAETGEEIRIQAAVPGFCAGSVQVDVLPNSLTIEGKARPAVQEGGEKIHFSEFRQKRLLRQFDLPARIDPEAVTATLDDGVLRIVAKKAAVATPVVAEVNGSRRAAA